MSTTEWKRQADHFDRHAQWYPGLELLRANGFKFRFILKDAAIAKAIAKLSLRPDSKVLDVGCGRGILLDRLNSSYQTLGYGVDVSVRSLKDARADGFAEKHLVCADARRLPFANDEFEASLSLDVLEHIKGHEEAIEEMLRVVQPGGGLLAYAVSKKYKYTWIWILTGLYRLLRIDYWSWSCHHPSLLIDPSELQGRLTRMQCSILGFEYFHSFFTLLFDNVLQAIWVLLTWVGVVGAGGHARVKATEWVFGLFTGICKVALAPANWLDAPWSRRGLSNGFLITVLKTGVD
jgi:ubiquinone/menaquinone biosynthesis C-methylase UbiE